MRKTIFIVLLIMLTILVVTAPATAARPEPAGARLSIFPGVEDTTFPAGEPFNISHGWAFAPPEDVPGGGLGFELWVDGVYHEADIVYRAATSDGSEGPSLAWWWVHNFPEGMTGIHTFTGEWFASCAYAVKSGQYAGPCSAPNEKVVLNSNVVEVTFLP